MRRNYKKVVALGLTMSMVTEKKKEIKKIK